MLQKIRVNCLQLVKFLLIKGNLAVISLIYVARSASVQDQWVAVSNPSQIDSLYDRKKDDREDRLPQEEGGGVANGRPGNTSTANRSIIVQRPAKATLPLLRNAIAKNGLLLSYVVLVASRVPRS